MEIKYIRKGALDYAIVSDIYTPKELVQIKQEIVALREKARKNSTGPAKDLYGRSLNFADSLWVDEWYEDRNKSSILTVNRKLFTSNIAEKLTEQNAMYAHIRNCSSDFTLLNYYDNGTQYKPHRDSSIFTAISFFSIGEFTGGQLVFVDYDEVIEPIENTMVIFAGCIKHEAKPVKTDGAFSYRASMAQFMTYKRDCD